MPQQKESSTSHTQGLIQHSTCACEGKTKQTCGQLAGETQEGRGKKKVRVAVGRSAAAGEVREAPRLRRFWAGGKKIMEVGKGTGGRLERESGLTNEAFLTPIRTSDIEGKFREFIIE